MSLRTLQRRAMQHGASIRQLVDDVRQSNAKALLADRTLSVLDVALLLGYSTDSAFRRAFRRWTGFSPARFRQMVTIT